MSAAERDDKPHDGSLIVLHLEDDPLDVELIRREFNAALPGSDWRHVRTEAEYRREIERAAPDLILADYNLPDFDGLSALAIARERRPLTPFLFVSGALGEEVAIETLKSGATDYVLKNRLSRLMPAVRRALAEAHERDERRRLEEELSEISNREQRRIGSDLHDGLGQELTGLSLMLRGIETAITRDAPQLTSQIVRIREVLSQAIQSTRALARGLSPVNLERGGLSAALEHLAHQCRSVYGLQCEYRGNVKPEQPIDETPATHLYRIAQEAMANAAKHAQAQSITICLTINDGGLLLEIRDDGKGVPDAVLKNPAGMGLRLMQYRARIIGGELSISPGTEGGTVISVYCPLTPAGSFQRHPAMERVKKTLLAD
jgi:signal transduction histidine kinase